MRLNPDNQPNGGAPTVFTAAPAADPALLAAGSAAPLPFSKKWVNATIGRLIEGVAIVLGRRDRAIRDEMRRLQDQIDDLRGEKRRVRVPARSSAE